MATLYSPSGEKYVTDSKVEITRLVAGHGYVVTEPNAAKPKAARPPKGTPPAKS